MTQQRNYGFEIRDETKGSKKKQPSRMFSFPGGISRSCLSFLCPAIQEAIGLWSALTPSLVSLGLTSLPPQAWGQPQAFFFGGP